MQQFFRVRGVLRTGTQQLFGIVPLLVRISD
jgi:hypothetical protein